MFRNLLFYFTAFAATTALHAQVGVNNPTPEQALDIEGKVKISDDATPPSDGTMRYNDGADDLEGYVDGEWKSLTKSATPDAPQPIVFTEYGLPNDAIWTPFDGTHDYTTSSPDQSLSNLEVPTGKFFVADQVCVTLSSGSNPNDYFYASVRPTRPLASLGGNQAIQNPQIVVGGSRRDGTTCVTANRAPLFVVRPTGSVYAWNSTNSGGEVRIMVYGFYVDDVEQYFTY